MAVQQLSIFAENQPGSLVAITDILQQAGIDIRAMSIADTQDFGIVRLIVSDTDKACRALSSAECLVTRTAVVAAAIPDRPGALTELVHLLADHSINLEYMYAFVTPARQSACVVLRVQDPARTETLLSGHGIPCFTEEEIRNL